MLTGEEAAEEVALLDDLLLLLGEPRVWEAPSGTPSEANSVDDAAPASTHGQCCRRNRRSGGASVIRRSLDALRREEKQLTLELQVLRERSLVGSGLIVDRVLQERVKRRRAENECRVLRDAVLAQTRFLRGVHSLFSPSRVVSDLAICNLLHSYTRLPRDRPCRRNEYAVIGHEMRLRNAMEMLSSETQLMAARSGAEASLPSLLMPHIQIQHTRFHDGFGISSAGVYAVDSLDLGAVLRAACVTARDILVTCEAYVCVGVEKELVDADAPQLSSGASVLYRTIGVHHKNKADGHEVLVESRVMTLYKEDEHRAVVLWDYVDDDELNPTSSLADITRQAIGGCLVRRELCEDGVERVVCRLLHTRNYRFRAHPPQDLLRRFQLAAESTAHSYELAFRGILQRELDKERQAYTRAVSLTETVEVQV